MPKMKIQVPHELAQEEAQTRITGMLGQLKEQYGSSITDMQESWSGDTGTFSFRAMGFNIAGTLRVTGDEVRFDGELPWAAKPFQSTIEATIRERTERLLRP